MTSIEQYRWYLYNHHRGVIHRIIVLVVYAIGRRRYYMGRQKLYFTYEDVITQIVEKPVVKQLNCFLSGFV